MLTDDRDVLEDGTSRPALPEWARPPAEVTEPARPSTRRGVAIRVAGAGTVAAVLWLLDHRWPAVILATVLTVTSVLSLAVPAVGTAIDRFLAGFQALVGRALTVLLLGLVHLVIFVPAALVLRLLRRDPLALGADPAAPTFWREAARRPGRPLHHRPFAYERHPEVRRRPARLRSVVGLVTIAGVLDLGLGLLVVRPGSTDGAVAEAAAAFITRPPNVGAAEGEPWAADLYREFGDNYAIGAEFRPFRGWAAPDMEGEHVNVTDGVRRSYETSLVGEEPIDVYFFGGSTMMGAYQRDEHTIASEVVRLAEADGIAVRAVNLGQAGYTNWQEMQLLLELLTDGDVPDVAVFYGGANELVAQFRSPEPTDEPTHIYADSVRSRLDESREAAANGEGSRARQLVDAYTSASAAAEAWRRFRGESDPAVEAVSSPWPNQHEHARARGEAAAAHHRRSVEIIEGLGREHGFDVSFFWQPWIYSKDVKPGEEDVVGSWATDPAAWTAAHDAAVAGRHPSVVDLTGVLDDLEEPVMYDFVHTNEAGARRIAEGLYDEIKPVLLEHRISSGADDDSGSDR